jgi:hypothetical protein
MREDAASTPVAEMEARSGLPNHDGITVQSPTDIERPTLRGVREVGYSEVRLSPDHAVDVHEEAGRS